MAHRLRTGWTRRPVTASPCRCSIARRCALSSTTCQGAPATGVPCSAIGGAIVLLAADVAARTLVSNADLPLGMLTSLIGGPFFFWLLRRTRAKQGGWA